MSFLTKYDLVTLGYWLYIVGSSLYLAQALNTYLTEYNTQDDYVLSGRYYYYGPESKEQASSKMSISAAVIFIIESIFYVISLDFQRTNGDPAIVLAPFYHDLNWWGNLLFMIGSFGYLVTACTVYKHSYYNETSELNLSLSVLFVVDSFLYLAAIIWSKASKVRFEYDIHASLAFSSRIDWYLIATILFIAGSVAYLVVEIQARLGEDSSDTNLLAAVILFVDAPCYLVTSYQIRNEHIEINLLERKNIFLIEESQIEISTCDDLMNKSSGQEPADADSYPSQGFCFTKDSLLLKEESGSSRDDHGTSS